MNYTLVYGKYTCENSSYGIICATIISVSFSSTLCGITIVKQAQMLHQHFPIDVYRIDL